MLAGDTLHALVREKQSTAQCPFHSSRQLGEPDKSHSKEQDLEPENRQAKILLSPPPVMVLYMKPIQLLSDFYLYLLDI